MPDKSPKFIPGLQLNRNFFFDVIKPLMSEHFPHVKYSAGLLANGSDVLGYDDPTSMDHNWGPRMRLILTREGYKEHAEAIDQMLREKLPRTYLDFPTNFTERSDGYLKQQMKLKKRGPINHLIRIYSLKYFFKYFIGIDPRKRLAVEDWLVIPQQALLEVTAGEVYHDQIGLEKYRQKFAYYPHDVWLYMMHIQWDRLANLLGFPSRVALTGDEFGSRLVANQVVMEMIQMLFLLEKRYMPYLKWRGRALRELANGPELSAIIERIHSSKNWKERQKQINKGHLLLGRIFNSLGIAPEVPLRETSFNERAFNVADIGPFAKASFDAIKSKKLQNASYPVGSIDQFFNHIKPNHLNYIYREFRNFVV